MLLKRVELQGFKSFADKIYLDFNPGITAIVGPNGSGKSNISDAIRWVMGEQSIKTLRGSKMEDVIFSGTQNRKSMGFAEVSLTLDNSQKFFSLEYEEITVTRRVYRSGESEYFINRVGCRLKDIHELFMDTGLGREGYSIIGQGRIDEILSNKSEDRRQIFEEAAGITKYKYRKNEAERKLENTTENLIRIKDIMTELENQIGPLFEQSEKAKKFLKLRDELKVIEINLSVVKIDKIKEDILSLSGQLEEIDSEIEKIRATVEENENNINSLYEQISEWNTEMEKCREAEKSSISFVAEKNSRNDVLLTDIKHYKESILKLEQTVNEYADEASSAEKQLAVLETELEQLQDRLNKIREEKKNNENIISGIRNLTQNQNEFLESLKNNVFEKKSEIIKEREKIANSQVLKNEFLTRKMTLLSELETKSKDYEKLTENISRLKKSKYEKENEKVKTEEKIRALKNRVNTLNNEKEKLSNDVSELDIRLEKKLSRVTFLEDMEKNYDGFNSGVKAVMQAQKNKLSDFKIFGPFSKIIKTSEKYTTAIDTALGLSAQNIVVKDENDAMNAIEFLKRKKAGRVTFLPIKTVKARNTDISSVKNMPGYINLASNLVEYDDIFSIVVSSLLGAVIVADNLDNAIKIAQKTDFKIKIVTLTGEIMQTGGAITGGSVNKTLGFLSRNAEISAVKDEISSIKESIFKKRKILQDTSETLEKEARELEKENNILSALNDESIKLNADFEYGNDFLKSVALAKSQLEENVFTLDKSIEEKEITISDCNKNILVLENEIKTLEDRSIREHNEFDNLMNKTSKIRENLVNISIEENSCEKDILSQNEKIKKAAELIDSAADKAENITKEKQELCDKIRFAEKEIESNKNELSDNEILAERLKKKLLDLEKAKTENEEEIRKLQKASTGTNDTMVSLGRQKAKLESKKTLFDSELEGIFSRLWDEYELTYSKAVEEADKNADLTNAEKTISALKWKIKNLGNINIDAIESYKEIKERYDFMLIQTNDLEKSKTELEKIISDLLSTMKSQFAHQFEIINRNFSKVFSELFGGGFANLSLADPDNLLESGIEIEVQPPGKKLQRLSLLSGGERALTAIALLFAILNVRPTPFCILDEIEAALDDVNVSRYAEYLKKYSKKAQFIVITHRRGTMEAANILYGVTMQERGVSKLLSLNIDEVTK